MKKKSASRTAQFNKIIILLIVSGITLCASPTTVLADSCTQQTNWSVSSGSWFVGSNWSAGVPNLNKSAQINNGGTATISSTGAESCDLTLGGAATDSGTLVVNQGALNMSLDAAVGGYGKGTLTITNGGTVTAALAAIAAVSGSKGAITVTGTNSQCTLSGALNVGVGDTGLLTISSGGVLTAANVHVYASGTLTGNSTVTATSGATIEGTIEPSSGRLTIAGNLTFFGIAPVLQCNVVPASADNVYVSGGTASLTGRLKVKMTGTFTPGTTYTLLHADVRNGTFSSTSIIYPTNQCFTPVITYDPNNVYLYLEPTC
jgi:autotransporter family porin